MKKLFLPFLFLCFSQIIFSQNYQIGDTLNVFAQSGLNLRNEPNLKVYKLHSIPFGTPVIVEGIFMEETIDHRIGNWVLVRTLNDNPGYAFDDEKGYAFDAYLSDLPLPDSIHLANHNLWEYMRVNLKKIDCEVEVNRPAVGENSMVKSWYQNLANGITICSHSSIGGNDLEFIFQNIRFGELITLTELFFSKYPAAQQNFQTELSTAFKKSHFEMKIRVHGEDFFLIILNGINTKSISILESNG